MRNCCYMLFGLIYFDVVMIAAYRLDCAVSCVHFVFSLLVELAFDLVIHCCHTGFTASSCTCIFGFGLAFRLIRLICVVVCPVYPVYINCWFLLKMCTCILLVGAVTYVYPYVHMSMCGYMYYFGSLTSGQLVVHWYSRHVAFWFHSFSLGVVFSFEPKSTDACTFM